MNAVCDTLIIAMARYLSTLEWRVALIRANPSRQLGTQTATFAELGGDEVRGAGYKSGGAALANARIERREERVCLNFDSVHWRDCDFAASGALIYCPALDIAGAVLDFGGIYAAQSGHPFYLPMDCPIRF